MMKNQIRLRLAAMGVATAISSMLAGCGADGNSVGGANANSGPGGAAQGATVSGTVASGSPVPNAVVTAVDVNGKTVTTQAGVSGAYTLDVTGLAQPVALVATDPGGQVGPFVSVLASTPAAGQSATANVTTLTTAVSALLTPGGNPLELAIPANLSAEVTPAKVQSATQVLDTYLTHFLSAAGVSNPAAFDPIGAPFSANHAGADAVIDMFRIVAQGSATYLTFIGATSAQGNVDLTLNAQQSPGSVPQPPVPEAAATVASLNAGLASLVADMQACVAAGGTGAACNVVDPGYMDNGYARISQYDANLQSATVVFGTPSIVETVGIPNATGGQGATGALIGIPYALTAPAQGQPQAYPYTLYTTVQPSVRTRYGWDIVGNQLPFDISATSRATYRNFHDSFVNSTGSHDASFFDAGVTLGVNLGGPGGRNIDAAHVTGPGLPSAGLWLVHSTVTGDGSLAIMAKQPSSQPAPGTTTGSNTNEYRWSWATLPGGAFTPPAKGFWSTGKLDGSLPLYGAYTFTLYDATGAALGTYSVFNPTPLIDAQAGLNAYGQGNDAAHPQGAWPVLGADVAAGFLSATGAYAGAQAALNVDFTPPPSPSPNPAQLTLGKINVQSEDQNKAGCEATVPVTSGATSVAVAAPTSPIACSFLAVDNASDAAYRIVQLRSKNTQGVQFYLNETYRSGQNAPDAS